MNVLCQIYNVNVIILIQQLGFKNGLKCGDRPTFREFYEAWLRHPDWLEPFGQTEMLPEEYAREVASHDKKVLLIKPKESSENIQNN